jgi:hypothetical protein
VCWGRGVSPVVLEGGTVLLAGRATFTTGSRTGEWVWGRKAGCLCIWGVGGLQLTELGAKASAAWHQYSCLGLLFEQKPTGICSAAAPCNWIAANRLITA